MVHVYMLHLLLIYEVNLLTPLPFSKLAFDLGDYVLRWSLGEPLIPGSIVYRRPGRSAQMCGQDHVTGSYTRATGATEWLLKVHL